MSLPRTVHRFRPVEWVLLGTAAAVGAALPFGAWFAPLYSGASGVAGAGVESTYAASSVEVNGSWVLIYAVIPLVVTLFVATVLWERDIRFGTGPVVWTVVGLLAALTLLGMMTIGIFVLPVTGCLLAVCIVRQAWSGRVRRPAAGPDG